ncbi:cilia- and flagella-associated protein 36 isoform X1 [Crotalus tigris]|uniref:cilia- and flagella-associated protein 36 isoform X1 n=1 Tax=Crotalus tigris TaxID=88082 RepID=UPI00192FABFC|nr:cilia- and flagella-associated protein 36 isoform X1 [Crotalus tigris]XP_039200306.1 cilia- and flagella-associated protein 36 isoform X1 [Crotalus tigris]
MRTSFRKLVCLLLLKPEPPRQSCEEGQMSESASSLAWKGSERTNPLRAPGTETGRRSLAAAQTCQREGWHLPVPALMAILQPVLAAEDFRLFKEMMVQKNIEMQLQAIRIIQERNGVLPDCLTDGSDAYTETEEEEMKILREVLRKSKEEYDLEQERKRNNEAHDKLKSSDVAHKSSGHFNESAGPKQSLEHSTKLMPGPEGKQKDVSIQDHSSIKLKEDSCRKAVGDGSEYVTKQGVLEGRKLSELGAKELREREDYLKQKRDALMALKKKSKTNIPPQNIEQKEELSPSKEGKKEEEEQRLLKKRILAAKLKEEVINKR